MSTRLRVWRGKAAKTPGGLMKNDLTKNKVGKIVSKRLSSVAKKKSNLGEYLVTPGKKIRKKVPAAPKKPKKKGRKKKFPKQKTTLRSFWGKK